MNGVRIEVSTDGSVRAYTSSSVDAYTNGAVYAHPAVTKDFEAGDGSPRVGEKMPDGTVYAGISPDTGQAMYTTPIDAPLTYTFNKALKYAQKLDVHGHQDWRPPTDREQEVLFRNRVAIGGFNVSGSLLGGWYWSASRKNQYRVWSRRFSDGDKRAISNYGECSLRCIR